MEINPTTNEINIKIVYYGPGLSGKTTNLEIIYQKTPENHRGKLTNIATEQDRTLFFDYMPLDLGRVGTLRVRLRIFTVPGQVYYNSTRKLVLRCVDGVVFVADSQEKMSEENVASLENLRENLEEYNLSLERIPLVMQFNKRDLPEIMSIEKMNSILNSTLDVPVFPAVAVQGDGVFQCLRSIANLTLSYAENSVTKTKKRSSLSDSSTRIPKSEVKTTFQPPKKKATTKTSFPFFKKSYKKITEEYPVQNQDGTEDVSNEERHSPQTPSLGVQQEKLDLTHSTPPLSSSAGDSGIRKLSEIFKKKPLTPVARETSKIFRPKHGEGKAFKTPPIGNPKTFETPQAGTAFKIPERQEKPSEKLEAKTQGLHPNLIRSTPHPNVLKPGASKAKDSNSAGLHPNVMRLNQKPKPPATPPSPNLVRLSGVSAESKKVQTNHEITPPPSAIKSFSGSLSQENNKASDSSLFRREDIEPTKKLSDSSLFRKEDIEPPKLSSSSLFRKNEEAQKKATSKIAAAASSLFSKEDIEKSAPQKRPESSTSSFFRRDTVPKPEVKPKEDLGKGLKSKIDLKKYKDLFGDGI